MYGNYGPVNNLNQYKNTCYGLPMLPYVSEFLNNEFDDAVRNISDSPEEYDAFE